jgi:dihydroorotase
MDRPESAYHNLQWLATGERLTRETFLKYRKQGGNVITFSNIEDMIEYSAHDPLPMIASDGFGFENGTSHPRSAGTFSRILGVYVREKQLMTIPEAIRKMTLAPAQRLEARVPSMKKKGRIRAGADADITIFDPATVRDRSTYERGKVPSEGIRHVIVGGTFVVRDGRLTDATPGQGIRAPAQ